MYKDFFGFRERPFKLVPDPSYLFLSRSHEEALAHLNYALTQGDGFVMITGEVGTGKTTLCRSFLRDLQEDTAAAYVFNPRLDSLQLLKAINDEFGIDPSADNTKDLIDTLNAFLMERKADGCSVILLIDEAQNLSMPVLEQLRLLSNLETSTHKLIQIILVGQPELARMLESYELRQLGQRITLSCRLAPLSYSETMAYIQHRIHIAIQRPAVRFSRSALRAVHKYAGGVPRLINMACDRALLTAFGRNRRDITGPIVRSAVAELTDRAEGRRGGSARGKDLLVLALLCLVLVITLVHRPVDIISSNDTGETGWGAPRPLPLVEEPVTVATAEAEKPGIEGAFPRDPGAEPVVNLADILADIGSIGPRRSGIEAILSLWVPTPQVDPQLNDILADGEYFRIAARQNGLLVRTIGCDLNLVRSLELPAIVGLRVDGSSSVGYLTLTGIGPDRITLMGGERYGRIEADPEVLMANCAGSIHIVWKDFHTLTGLIPYSSPPDSVIALKMLLLNAGFDGIEVNPIYGENAERAVREIQHGHRIGVDGVVGAFTKIVLYNRIHALEIPHITGSDTEASRTQRIRQL